MFVILLSTSSWNHKWCSTLLRASTVNPSLVLTCPTGVTWSSSSSSRGRRWRFMVLLTVPCHGEAASTDAWEEASTSTVCWCSMTTRTASTWLQEHKTPVHHEDVINWGFLYDCGQVLFSFPSGTGFVVKPADVMKDQTITLLFSIRAVEVFVKQRKKE